MKFKKFLRVLLNIFFWGFTAAIAGLAALIFIYGNDLPDYKNLATYAPPVATRLYASDGSLLIEYAEERRVFIDYDDMQSKIDNELNEMNKIAEFYNKEKTMRCFK